MIKVINCYAIGLKMIKLNHSPVHSNPAILGGTLVFRGTRVPAQTILDYLNDGISLTEFFDNFSSVKREDAENFIKLTRDEEIENHIG